jgi:putative redox protein
MTTITVRSRHNYQQEIIAGDHIIFADEPVDVGGDDTGPNPYELLLGALGACTSITLQMYAKRKGWPLEGVEVELIHRRDHARDCEECAETETRIDVVELRLDLKGDLDAAQRTRLHEIAQRCPVNQTLTRGIRTIHTEMER